MTVRDPVCGMTLEDDQAAALAFLDGSTYHFCAAGCKVVFENDPDRFLGVGSGLEAGGAEDQRSPGSESGGDPLRDQLSPQPCPGCGGWTAARSQNEVCVGSLSVDELETLTLNEWRRRLGAAAYGRRPARGLVRALLVFGLAPESPIRCSSVEEALAEQLSIMRAWGLSRDRMERDLFDLTWALWFALCRADLTVGLAWEFLEPIHEKLMEIVDWEQKAGSDQRVNSAAPTSDRVYQLRPGGSEVFHAGA